MADNKWIHIDNWMGKLLGLRANDLICFAVIYAFTRDGKTQFRGDLSYLAATMFATKPTVLLCLKKLLDQKLILKQEETVNGIKRCYYQTNIICDDGRFYIIDPSKEPLTANKESLMATIKESLTVYINDNKENNKGKEDNNKSLSSKKKRFSKPTIEQIDAYIKEKKLHFDAEGFFDYYESKGWLVGKSPMKDWKAACRTWEHNRKSQEKKEEPTEETDCVMDPKEWLGIVVWLQENAYKIHSQIDAKMFCKMKEMAGDSKLLAEIIIEIGELAQYNSVDVMTEFRRILKERKL